MKSLFLAVSLAILASCAPAFAGPILQDWCFVGTNTCTSPYNHYITATGTYTLNQQDALKAFPVNLTRIGATDTITAYHSQNVATTITTSLGTAIVYHGAAGATSVTIPATQSLINVECDGSKCYIN